MRRKDGALVTFNARKKNGGLYAACDQYVAVIAISNKDPVKGNPANNAKARALDLKNYPLLEVLEENYALGLVTTVQYEAEVKRLLHGTKNLRLVFKACTSTAGFIEYKSKWGPKYHGNTQQGLHAHYSRRLAGFLGPLGPIDELSGLPTVLRTYRPITRNAMMWVDQRWDVEKGRDDEEQDGAHFPSVATGVFANDDSRESIESMLVEIAETHEPSVLLPATWDPATDPVPPVPAQFHNFDDEAELADWIDVHLGHLARDGSGRFIKGMWYSNEAAKKVPRPVNITREQIKQLWRINGGSLCRYFGIRGSFVPGTWRN
ncbi:hypothetical protein HDU78_005629 [Chytriomyces hyalinus]|nr:hypothetical protein HDU78_005629 [Chytriomyces hyalinus]